MYISTLYKFLFVLLFLCIGRSGQCCINEYRVLVSGEVLLTEVVQNAAPQGRFDLNNKSYLLQKLHQADSIYKSTGHLEDYSDFASLLVYTGQYQQAKQIFHEIEEKSPRLYQTAANLGTTYELLGQNDSALYWIKRAIEINPNSHEGSEWIHVKILDAKIRANGNEQYLWDCNILSLDFGDDEIPINKNQINLDILRKDLYYQLYERMSFVKPQDPIVAQLLFDLGNVCALTDDATSGLQIYKIAKKYGYSSKLFNKRKNYFQRIQIKADFNNNIFKVFGLLILGGIVLIFGLLFWFRQAKKGNTKR
jgi:tetratricopeptide (TPR) repeat protein